MKSQTMDLQCGYYVHVPFCRQRCHYCHFDIKVLHPQSNASEWLKQYETHLLQEMQHLAMQYSGWELQSIYFGGGTPSRLGTESLVRILEALKGHHRLLPNCEISLEINPDDIEDLDFERLIHAGFNRVSLGVQTFHDPSLLAIRRPHSGQQAHKALTKVPAFPRGRSFDLMLGLPHQTLQSLENDLIAIETLGFEHVSLYMLERDLPSPIDKQANLLPSEDQQAEWYEFCQAKLDSMGLIAYEISNFARTDFQSIHNLNYWNCGNYLAVGPAAHGQIGNLHYQNEADLSRWMELVRQYGSGIVQREQWDSHRLNSEKKIQGLRRETGIPLSWLSESEMSRLNPFLSGKLLEVRHDSICLTLRGKLLANEIFEIFLA
ncbi:MAG: radical SAM family heme chaperone HemW [Acidobacteria bacterium]|nr:radical SAM family heme chaperone HemW [Acidobacteriota bacterium]MCB9399304.1 radical SAM family heme chaperone HemW [Acidobacteriota bacterium]